MPFQLRGIVRDIEPFWYTIGLKWVYVLTILFRSLKAGMDFIGQPWKRRWKIKLHSIFLVRDNESKSL